MTHSLSLDREQFAAKRRSQQDEFVERLSGVIGATFSTGDIDPLMVALENMYVEVYDDEVEALVAALTPSRLKAAIERFLKAAREMLSKATPESSVSVTALALANAVLNDATASAYDGEVEMEWVSMRDEDVRETHEVADGQRRAVGEKFSVGESEMRFPGDITAPVKEWINCRCSLRPVKASVTAAASKEAGEWFAIMAVPGEADPVHQIGPEDKHATVVYFGEVFDAADIHDIAMWTNQLAADAQPFVARVKSVEPLGHPGDDGQAHVWLLEDSDLNGIFEGAFGSDDVQRVYDAADTTKYDTYTPHVTIGYDIDQTVAEAAKAITEISFDRLAVWHGGSHTEFTLGDPMPDDIETPADEPIKDIPEVAPEDADAPIEDTRVPWHGVLAPENVRSGDGRMFTNLGRTRDLPLPLTWQEVSDDGHKQNITVASIEKVAMIDGLMHASGYFLASVEEADEAVGLISEFGRFGVSVDADDIGSASFDEETDTETYDDPRISSACIVSIPAFPEAFVMLGPHPVLDAVDPIEPAEGVDIDEQIEEKDESLAAAGLPLLKMAGIPESFKAAAMLKAEAEARAAADWSDIITAADVAPGRTEDGPGWLTHPVDTDRLRDYWVSGPGAAKIGWGAPGDFNRCRLNVGEYVKPQYLNGYCANRHYDALGVWPGREAAASDTIATRLAEGVEVPAGLVASAAPALTLVAAAGWNAPSEFFAEPVECEPGDGVVITPEGRVYGYIAEWGVCHIGYDGMCKEAPPSAANYAYFRTGSVNTPDGPVAVGSLTAATGHANPKFAAMPAAAHYDNTGSVWAFVAAGENDRGIWFSGMVKPGTDEELINDVIASGRLSGDWRPIGNELELVAALTVNVPGFPIPKTTASASNGRQLSLVAAGVPGRKIEEGPVIELADASQMGLIASLVVDEIEARESRRARLDALKAKVN